MLLMRHLLTTLSSGRLRNTLSEMQLTKICTAYLPHRPSEYHLEVEPGKEVIERVKLLKEFLLTRLSIFSLSLAACTRSSATSAASTASTSPRSTADCPRSSSTASARWWTTSTGRHITRDFRSSTR